MRRFFVERELLATDEVVLQEEVHHHLYRVLRLPVGSEIQLLDGQGLVVNGEILELTKNVARVRVLTRIHESPPSFSIRLIQGLPKGEKMDLILQKGTELGVGRFTPWIAGRSVARPGRERHGKLFARWERIVREASRQSRRTFLPRLDPPLPLGETLKGPEDLKLVLWEEESLSLHEALPVTGPSEVAILVGPEGGLAAPEVAQARQAGFVPVSLGRRILRTETAGFAVVAILQYLYGDLGCAGFKKSARKPSRKELS